MTPDQVNQLFSFLYEGEFGQVTFWLRLISGVISSALIAAIVVIAVKFWELYRGRQRLVVKTETYRPPQELVSGPWVEVMRKIESPNPSDWNLAVIQADAILDNLLRAMGLFGETMGDRLKQLDRSKLNSLDEVWEAHKLRNRIAHATDRVLTREEARGAINLYAKALHELQYLEE